MYTDIIESDLNTLTSVTPEWGGVSNTYFTTCSVQSQQQYISDLLLFSLVQNFRRIEFHNDEVDVFIDGHHDWPSSRRGDPRKYNFVSELTIYLYILMYLVWRL